MNESWDSRNVRPARSVRGGCGLVEEDEMADLNPTACAGSTGIHAAAAGHVGDARRCRAERPLWALRISAGVVPSCC